MPPDKLQEELTAPVRCVECGEITPANEGSCVHCGASISEIDERKSIDKQLVGESANLDGEGELGGAQPASWMSGHSVNASNTVLHTNIDTRRENKTLDLSKELATYKNAENFAVEKYGELESDTVGIVVEKFKVSEEEVGSQHRRAAYHHKEVECPFDKGDILELKISGFPKRLQLVELAFSTQLATGFYAIDLEESPPITSILTTLNEHLPNTQAPYFFEVYVSGNAPITNLSTSQCQLFRASVGEGRYKGTPFRVFDETDSISLETFVEQAKRKLPLEQIIGIYRAILDLVICAHSQKSLIFGISPWTVRLLNDSEDCPTCRIQDPELRDEISDDTAPDEVSDPSFREGKEDDFLPAETNEHFLQELREPSLQTLDFPVESFGGREQRNINTEDENTYRAVFDGLETLYPMGEMPEAIPLITGFAASEFLVGVTQMVGPQADVFSLGALLYYLVTGHVPPSSIHTQYAPALPMRNFRPDFPPGLEAVIARATRLDPSERYENVRQLRNDFEHAIAQIQHRAADCQNPRKFSIVRAAVDKHIGIAKGKRMPVNQDSVFCAVNDTGRLALVVIADGVTRATYGRGDIASKFVTDAAEAIWKDVVTKYDESGLFHAEEVIQTILALANDQLVDYVNENYYPFSGGVHEVMGSTVILACVEDGNVTLATLGDSRAYLYTDIGLEQLTVDHNLWTLNVLEGALPVDRVRSMPFADALARCVGSFRVVERKLEALPPEPDIHKFYLRNGDRLLISTDGLTDYVGINRDSVEEAIHKVLRRETDPALAALELILLANRGGGGDNIGVGIIDFH